MGLIETDGTQKGSAPVQKEAKRARRGGWRDVIICLIIIIAALLYQESRAGRNVQAIGVRLSQEETELTVVGADAAAHVLVFSALESVELFPDLENLDRGEQLDGEDTKTVTSGRFRNAAYGEYALHVMNKLHNYILTRGPDGTLVFNFESDETTKAVYDYICEHLPDK